jgi:hypothetical protein
MGKTRSFLWCYNITLARFEQASFFVRVLAPVYTRAGIYIPPKRKPRTNQEHSGFLGDDKERIVSFQRSITFLKKGLAISFGLGQIENIESDKTLTE